MIAMTAFVLAVAMAAGFAQYLHEQSQKRNAPTFTFIVDPPTMFIVGLLTAFIGLLTKKGRKLTVEQFRGRKKVVDRLLVAFFLVFFFLIEMPAYFDLGAGDALGFLNFAHQDNNFMWNGYVELLGWKPFHFDQPTYQYWWSYPVLALMAGLQWFALRAGRALGYMSGDASMEDEKPQDKTP